MDKTIETIFDAQVKTEDFLTNVVSSEDIKEEGDQYMYLYQQLGAEEKKALHKYCELARLRSVEELKAAYEQGFKTAIKLMMNVWKE